MTVQLPIFNEQFVVDRLIDAVCRLEYPRDRFEIQVLDDSTDETVEVAREIVERYARGVCGDGCRSRLCICTGRTDMGIRRARWMRG